jgi:hypothetical protein
VLFGFRAGKQYWKRFLVGYFVFYAICSPFAEIAAEHSGTRGVPDPLSGMYLPKTHAKIDHLHVFERWDQNLEALRGLRDLVFLFKESDPSFIGRDTHELLSKFMFVQSFQIAMYYSFVFGSIFFTAVFTAPAPLPYTIHERRSIGNSNWQPSDIVLDKQSVFPLSIGLTQSNLEKGHDYFMNVADPESPNYAKHWTAEEVGSKSKLLGLMTNIKVRLLIPSDQHQSP